MSHYDTEIDTEHEPEAKRFRCRHIFTDGRRCKSACLRAQNHEENFCYYHHTTRRPVANPAARRRCHSTFALPSPADLADRTGIQLAIGEVLQRIAANDLDPRRAGLLLYGLQIASLNLPKSTPNPDAKPEPTVEEVELDPTHGPLAPHAEINQTRRLGSAGLALLRYGNEYKNLPEDHPLYQAKPHNHLDSLQASAAKLRSHCYRRPPNPNRMLIYATSVGGGRVIPKTEKPAKYTESAAHLPSGAVVEDRPRRKSLARHARHPAKRTRLELHHRRQNYRPQG